MAKAKQVLYEGSVQGVGFRYTVKRIAHSFEVTGWVRNLTDGRVELQVTGEESEVGAFLRAIGESELRSHIRNQSETSLGEAPGTRGFQIRHD